MRKLTTTLAFTAGMAIAATAHAQDVPVSGKISQTHFGTLLSCFVVDGQWFGVSNQYPTQALAVHSAADRGRQIKFLADMSVTHSCHGTQNALDAHDIDEWYP